MARTGHVRGLPWSVPLGLALLLGASLVTGGAPPVHAVGGSGGALVPHTAHDITPGVAPPREAWAGASGPSPGMSALGHPASSVPFHPAPTWAGWDPQGGRPSPNMAPDLAATVPLTSAQCVTSFPPWAWLTFDPLDDAFWVASPSSCVAVVTSAPPEWFNVTASYPVGTDPFGVAVDLQTGFVYVTNTGSDNVTVLNGTTGANVANIPVGSNPYGIAYDASTGAMYVANGGSDNVSVISGSTRTVVDSIGVGTDPIGLAVDPVSDQLFVANNGSANVTVVATSSDTVVANVDVGQSPYGVALDNLTDQVYVTNRGSETVSVLDAWNDSVAVTIGTGLGMNPEGVAYNPVDQLVWVGAAFYTVVINTTSQTVLGYLATDPSGVAVDPTSGLVCVTNTANATLRCIVYPNPIFPGDYLKFVETGLPSATNWSVTLYWPGYYHVTQWNASYAHDQVDFYVFNGTTANYTYVIPPAGGYYPTVPRATVEVSGWDTVNVTFVPASDTYPLAFSETGLPIGTTWSVTLGGVENQSTSPTLGFREPNGSYGFSVAKVVGFAATPTVGGVLVQGASVNVSVGFAPTPPAPGNLTVTFVETGVPNGQRWEVAVNGAVGASYGSSLNFSLAPGTYGYQLYPLAQFVPAPPAAGTFSLTTRNLTIAVSFVPVYSLLFEALGLPTGTGWSMTIDTLAESSSLGQIRVELPAGLHTFAVDPVQGFSATPAAGQVRLAENTTVFLSFSLSRAGSSVFPVTFVQTGLPSLTAWCVTVNRTDLCSDTQALSTDLPNGSGYGYDVRPVPGYSAQPPQGTFSVDGSPVNVTIAFVAVPPPVSPPNTPFDPYWGLAIGVCVGMIFGGGVGFVAGLLVGQRRRGPR